MLFRYTLAFVAGLFGSAGEGGGDPTLTISVFGDSLSVSHQIPVGQSYKNILAAHLGRAITRDYAANNNMAADQGQIGVGLPVIASEVAIVMVGANDERFYQTDPAKKFYFEEAFRRLVADRVLTDRVTARSASMIKVGAWNNTQVNSIGMNTTALNASAKATISGDAVYIGYNIQNQTAAKGAADVYIDGIKVGSLSSDGTAGFTTTKGQTWGPTLARFSGLSEGPHEVEVRVTSSGVYFYLDYIAGNDQPAGPMVLASNIIRMAPHGYAQFGGSDANVADYNASIAAIVSALASDGFDIRLVDSHSRIDPAVDLMTDGIHTNLGAQAKLAAGFIAAAEADEPPEEEEPPIDPVSFPLPSGGSMTIQLDEAGKVDSISFQ